MGPYCLVYNCPHSLASTVLTHSVCLIKAPCLSYTQVFKVLGEDAQIFALKEVYLKNLDDTVKKAYLNEIRLLKRLRDKPEIITLYD